MFGQYFATFSEVMNRLTTEMTYLVPAMLLIITIGAGFVGVIFLVKDLRSIFLATIIACTMLLGAEYDLIKKEIEDEHIFQKKAELTKSINAELLKFTKSASFVGSHNKACNTNIAQIEDAVRDQFFCVAETTWQHDVRSAIVSRETLQGEDVFFRGHLYDCANLATILSDQTGQFFYCVVKASDLQGV
ncbi:hypothetical protein MXMO3_03471 (plasmid) [Maritalea myrionectae]|uniref:Uncharacterized protein n=1 Tax=Maritalea myrionectae TaxID=454601 RepID=A0A2R4MJ44_9HYPH|nr:hypothetical protein [Maritalea myrionectae]AVX05974.1 hypothetical protein MXMO3_03471 [Maritalea myrionectae]